MKICNNINEFMEHVASSPAEAKARIDRRPTIEVGYRSEQGQIMPGQKAVERINRFLLAGTKRLAQTESGDCWAFKRHKNPRIADYFAYPV